MPARPRHLRVMLTAVAVATVTLLGATAAAAAPGTPGTPRYGPGADGAGDPYFPLAGNGGIDVVHYNLDLDYTPPAPEPPAPGLAPAF